MGGRREGSWLASQGARRNTPGPCTQLSRSPLPPLHGNDDFMGHSSRGARFKLLGMLREGPCVKKHFNPSPACTCLNHPGKTGRNSSSACCRGRRLQHLKHRSSHTRRCVINGHTHVPSAPHGTEHSPPLPLLPQHAALYLKPICNNRSGFSKARQFVRSDWKGLPTPEDAPGGAGRAGQGWGRWEMWSGDPCSRVFVEGSDGGDVVQEPARPQAHLSSPAQPSAGLGTPGTELAVPKWRVTPRICGQLKE